MFNSNRSMNSNSKRTEDYNIKHTTYRRATTAKISNYTIIRF